MDTSPNKVTVTTSARLHMGFFDLSGDIERKFGSLGMSIDKPCTHLEITKSKEALIDANCSENVAKIVKNIAKSLNVEYKFSLKLLNSIPEHAGLGSGTQMALAIGVGLNQLFDMSLSTSQIALHAQRGKRSGIGIAAFEHGGVLLDSGRTKLDEVPKILAREVFPEAWRVILVQDCARAGIHGAEEFQAFEKLSPAKNSLRDMVFSHMLPALRRADLLAFGAYMQDLQAYNGDYFAPIQGGRFASGEVAEVLNWLQNNGAACVGQSSWGPTGFAILEDQQSADVLQTQAQIAFKNKSSISFLCCSAKNTGAIIVKSSSVES
jgi:beta-ribofuranosylaminobenzene 5'-phosphate synthase